MLNVRWISITGKSRLRQTRLAQCLQELPGKGETEQKMLGEMAHKREYLEQTLLGINGAIQYSRSYSCRRLLI